MKGVVLGGSVPEFSFIQPRRTPPSLMLAHREIEWVKLVVPGVNMLVHLNGCLFSKLKELTLSPLAQS
jgi:hypothetical protein